MAIALIGALIIGLSLGLLGSGGSILTVPILVYMLDRPEKVAVAESLAIVGMIALAGVIPYARQKQIDWRTVLFFGLPGIAGVSLGACCSFFISSWVQLTFFSIVLLGIALFILFGPESYEIVPRSTYSKWGTALKGGLLGTMTGLLGIGGGVLIVPSLVIFCSLQIPVAVGTSLVIISLNAMIGFSMELFALRLLDLHINWHVILLFALLGILGCFAGSFISHNISKVKLRKVLGCGILVLGASMLFTQLI